MRPRSYSLPTHSPVRSSSRATSPRKQNGRAERTIDCGSGFLSLPASLKPRRHKPRTQRIQASLHAQAADELANEDAVAAAMLNRLVSDLDDYRNEFEVDVFFPKGSADLDEAAIRDLANLADIAKSLNGYMIEIAGYSSNTLNTEADQKAERRTRGYRRPLFPRQKHPATAHPRAGWVRQYWASRQQPRSAGPRAQPSR